MEKKGFVVVEMTTKEVQSKLPVTSEVYTLLKEKIIALTLMPGQILMVQQLSKELGISRTPVREAVVRLCDDGLVEECDGRKFRVTAITWKMLDDIYEVRQALEGQALTELAGRITPKQCSHLQTLVEQMVDLADGTDPAQYFAADNAFHSLLLKMHGNSLMLNFTERIKDQQQRIRYLTTGIRGRMQDSVAEHQDIVDALRSGNGEGARAALKRHLDLARDEVKQLLQSQYARFLLKD